MVPQSTTNEIEAQMRPENSPIRTANNRLMEARGLKKYFPIRRGILRRTRGTRLRLWMAWIFSCTRVKRWVWSVSQDAVRRPWDAV